MKNPSFYKRTFAFSTDLFVITLIRFFLVFGLKSCEKYLKTKIGFFFGMIVFFIILGLGISYRFVFLSKFQQTLGMMIFKITLKSDKILTKKVILKREMWLCLWCFLAAICIFLIKNRHFFTGLIFGIGISLWFEMWRFDKKRRFFHDYKTQTYFECME